MQEHYALLLGAMKTGTTALYMALARHPDVLACREKEPAYWIKDEAQGRGLDPYRALWDLDQNPSARWRMEASTGYTKLPVRCSPAPRLRGLPAEFRFLYVVRNPIDRIRSQYEHSLAEGWIGQPLTEGIDRTAIWFSNYHQQLAPFIDCFGRERIHVLSHEELCANPAGTLEGVCDFLEIDASLIPDTLPRANTGTDYRGRRLKAARQFAAERGLALSDEELQAELTRQVTPGPEQIEFIRAELEEDLRRFEATFGIDPWTGRRTESCSGVGA